MPAPKQNRPRIDGVLNHIKKGSYDGDLGKLREAIDARNEVRKDALMAVVKEVFGSDAVVTTHMPNETPRQRPGGPVERVEGEILPGESPHVLDPDSPEGQAAAEGLRSADPEDDPDIESRSPVIGSLEDLR